MKVPFICALLSLFLFGFAPDNTRTSPREWGKPGTTRHDVFFERTDHELHVYRLIGREPGNTILIIGGIHGNEPGAYLAADKYVDLTLRTGNLIIVPRANLGSILSDQRGNHGDYNRKFAGELRDDNYDDRIITILKGLIDDADLLLNLHDGSGFYRSSWVDQMHNPFRYGQSIMADCEAYDSGSGQVIHLGDIARHVVDRVNLQINESPYQFHFANHNSVDPNTRYPEMRKTATFYALTRHRIPAFGIETSKSLPEEVKVAHQVLAINAFMEEFGVIADMPNLSIVQPRLDYLVIDINGTQQVVVRNGGKLSVRPGDRVRVDHIVGNYERHLYADVEGLAGLNDNGKEFVVTRNVNVRVRKDAVSCGSIEILPDARADTSGAGARLEGSFSETGFLVELNGARTFVSAGATLELVVGDSLRLLDYFSPDSSKGINVNFHGFVGNTRDNKGEDRGYLINTARDLMKNWSIGGDGTRYNVAAKKGERVLSEMIVSLREPQVRYLVIRCNGGEPELIPLGKSVNVAAGDRLAFLEAGSNCPDGKQPEMRVVYADSHTETVSENTELTISIDPAARPLRLEIVRGQVVIGSFAFSW